MERVSLRGGNYALYKPEALNSAFANYCLGRQTKGEYVYTVMHNDKSKEEPWVIKPGLQWNGHMGFLIGPRLACCDNELTTRYHKEIINNIKEAIKNA